MQHETHIRSFIAIEIDDSTREILSDIQNELKRANADLKFVAVENIHLTLHFLGDLEIVKIELLKNSLQPVISAHPIFTVKPQILGAFPETKNPRVIWVNIEKGKLEVTQLQEKIGQELKKLNIELEEREFHPHLTLVRVKSKKNIHILSKMIKEFILPEFSEITVKEVTLFKSTLTPKGPIYKILTKWKLES